MGTMIELRLGNLSVDWGKNTFYTDHLSLFQEKDVRNLIPVDAEDGSNAQEQTLARRLKDVAPRLSLLGYTLEAARQEYEGLIEEFVDDDDGSPSFDDFLAALCKLNIGTISPEYEDDHSFGEFFREEIGPRLQIQDLFESREDTWNFAYIMENFHPWHVLTILAQNPANLVLMVVWDYFAHMNNGWSKPNEFRPQLKPEERFLLVTEGSSDSKVIRKAFDMLRPAVSDFFYFIDMEEGYPFSGSGSLASFCRGLMKIGIQNKTIIIFDNDAEGTSKQKVLQDAPCPENFAIMRLPDLPELRAVAASGTSGESVDDINGKAASIEAYLDFTWNTTRPAMVRWTNFVQSQNAYQGALESKTFYVRQFLELRGTADGYDTSKLEVVVQTILRVSEFIAKAHPARSR
jgi:HEPN/Toprim N-terminal domain 1